MKNERLVEDNMNLVHFIIKTYYPTFTTDEDIIQAGMLGLCRAANAWDGESSKFSTFASRCIINDIRNEFTRRRKHYGLLSLDYEVGGEDGTVPFGDLLEGEQDIDFVDIEPVMKRLRPIEREVLSLLAAGASPSDITRKYGWTKQRTNNIMRKIRLVWRNYNGD